MFDGGSYGWFYYRCFVAITFNFDYNFFQSVTVSPPNEAISIDFRPIKLQSELLRPITVAHITFKGEK